MSNEERGRQLTRATIISVEKVLGCQVGKSIKSSGRKKIRLTINTERTSVSPPKNRSVGNGVRAVSLKKYEVND